MSKTADRPILRLVSQSHPIPLLSAQGSADDVLKPEACDERTAAYNSQRHDASQV
jgi:hypothetical protein